MEWFAENDPDWPRLQISPDELIRLLVAFHLNAFGYLADGKTGGATSLYRLGSKFPHQCLNPCATFHGQDGALAFRCVTSSLQTSSAWQSLAQPFTLS